MKTLNLFAVLTAIALSGCTNTPPSCADTDATDLVKQIVIGQLEKAATGSETTKSADGQEDFSVNLKGIRIVSKASDTGDYQCSATIDIKSPRYLPRNFNNEATQDITYKTEIEQETKKAYITVFGLNF